MWNSAKDPQEEKYQQKLEAILEEKHKAISERSYLLINIIFVVLGAYAVVLSAILIQSLPFSLANNSTSSQTMLLIKTFFPSLCLVLSISYILLAFSTLLLSINTIDEEFITKLEIENGHNHNSKYIIHISKNNMNKNNLYYSAHLKDGEELANSNKELLLNTDYLQFLNHYSVMHLLTSLLLFISFIFLMTYPEFLIFFFIGSIGLKWYYTKKYNKIKNEIKQL